MNVLALRRRTLGKNVYKKTTEGNPAIAQGSLARMYPGIKMQGWTEQDSYEGNQLFNASVFDGMEKSGVSVSVDNGVITASGMSESAIRVQSANFTEEDFKKFKSGNIYVKNYKTSDCNYEVGIYINNVTVKEGNSPHNIPDGYLETNPRGVYFFIDIRAGVELKGSCKPMIYQDGDGTWEPYTGGQPSPSPDYKQDVKNSGKYNEESQKYEYQVKLTGANLFDVSSAKQVDSWEAGNVYRNLTTVDLKPNTTYTLFVQENNMYKDFNPDYNGRFALYLGEIKAESAPNYLFGNANVNVVPDSYTFTTSDNPFYINLYVDVWNEESLHIVFDELLVDVMLVEGASIVLYEPYHLPQTVTLTSDRPLTKWDKLEKRNGQWGWVYKSAEIVLDGSEDEVWEFYKENTTQLISFQIDLQGDMTGSQVSLCDKYINKYGAWYMDEYGIYSDHKTKQYKYFRPPSAEVETAKQWTDWLAQNPLTLWYEIAEETFVPLSESEQEQMNALHTYRPTTVLSNDCDCNMTLTYKTKKSLQPVSGGV